MPGSFKTPSSVSKRRSPCSAGRGTPNAEGSGQPTPVKALMLDAALMTGQCFEGAIGIVRPRSSAGTVSAAPH